MAKINLGQVRYTDRGAWVSGYTFTSQIDSTTKTGYVTGDVVQHNNNVYSSLVDGNTVEPGTDDTKWSLWVNGKDAADAATAANKAAEDAQYTADHSSYVGEDNYVYKWNKTTKTYDKTDIYVKGDKGDKGDTGATGGALWPTFKTVNNHLYAVDNGSNLAERIKVVNNHLIAVL